jgi:hypothetical protein
VTRLRFTLADRRMRFLDMGSGDDRGADLRSGDDHGRRGRVINHCEGASGCQGWGDVGGFHFRCGGWGLVRSSDSTWMIVGVCTGVVAHVLPVVPLFAEEA